MNISPVNDIHIANPFIYRIYPEDYISLTENLIRNRNLFIEIDKAVKTKDEELIKKCFSILKKWKDNSTEEIEKMYRDFEIYKYFYKEVGASLKFNPLSKKESGVFIIEKVLDFL